MSVNVGDVVIGLRGDVARLQADMNEAKKVVSSAMKDIEQYVGYAKSAFVAFGGVLTISAFKDAIAGAIEFKARLYDLQTQTGISVTALGAMAKTGRLTQTSLEDIAGASAKLSKAIQTQNEDSKGAAQAIAALGLNFDKFKELKPEDQMLAVARAMAGFSDGAGKTTAAMLLFGKTGATLLPFLRDLAERTDLTSKQTFEAAQKAKEFETNLNKLKAAGGEWRDQIVNDMLPALTAFTKQMVEAKTAGEKFAAIWKNIKGNLGVDDMGLQIKKVSELNAEVASAFSAFETSSRLADAIPGGKTILGPLVEINRRHLDEIRKQAAEESEILKGMANAASPLGGDANYSNEGRRPKPEISGLAAPEKTKKERDLYSQLIKTVNERIAQQQMEADLGRQLTATESLQAKAYSDIDTGVIKATLAQKLYVDGLFQQALAEEKLAKEREESRKENDKTLDAAEHRLEALQQERKAVDLELEQFGLTREELQALISARDRNTAASLRGRAAALDSIGAEGQLRDLYLAQADALDQVASKKDQLAAKEARERNDPSAGAARAVKDYLSDIKRAGDATASAVQNGLKSLEDATVSILRGGNAKDAARQWVNSILAEIYRLYVVKPLLASIFGGGSGGAGGFFGSLLSLLGGGGGSGMTSGGGGMAAPGGIAPLAAGTNRVPYDGFLARLHEGEAVVPAAYNPAIGGGAQVTLNVVNNGEPVKATANQRQTDQGMVIDLVLEAVAADVAGGGKVANAMANTYQLNRAGSAPRY